ncbi:hypothetical protein CAPTEDRAFT_184855 [Capitella teleta]|uniref:Uncharacterized protein n=1 Tax=Capitella teleta TaxID=283909 RepID=X1ZH63_CAPTE|nr:hypothetical protein CAPTEDRAFT_184855 [Capitella teleta]|eukprot:ELT90069.1 hypothetical protein CAPTEDRAFT_184855 [Capitella teleta]
MAGLKRLGGKLALWFIFLALSSFVALFWCEMVHLRPRTSDAPPKPEAAHALQRKEALPDILCESKEVQINGSNDDGDGMMMPGDQARAQQVAVFALATPE